MKDVKPEEMYKFLIDLYGEKSVQEWFEEAVKDREIVKKLKEFNHPCDCEYGGCVHSEAQKLLGKEEEVRTDGDRDLGSSY